MFGFIVGLLHGFVIAGANDYLTYPIISDEVRLVVDSIFETKIKQSELDYLRDRFWKSEALEAVQTKNDLMKQVFKKLRSVAPTNTGMASNDKLRNTNRYMAVSYPCAGSFGW